MMDKNSIPSWTVMAIDCGIIFFHQNSAAMFGVFDFSDQIKSFDIDVT